MHRHAWARLLLQASLAASAASQTCAWFPPSSRVMSREELEREVRAALRLAQADGLRPPATLRAWLSENLPAGPLIEAAEALLPGIGSRICRGIAQWPSLRSESASSWDFSTACGDARPWRALALEAQALLLARAGETTRSLQAWEQVMLVLPVQSRLQALALALDAGSSPQIVTWAQRMDGSKVEQAAQAQLVDTLRRRRRSPGPLSGKLRGDCGEPARLLALALE